MRSICTTRSENTSNPAMNARMGREQAYWDEVYRGTGAEHEKYLWNKHVEGLSYTGEYFRQLTSDLKDKRVLSLGGGDVRLAIELAKGGSSVTTVDIAATAAALTSELAKQVGVSERLTAVAGPAEEVVFEPGSFDGVIFKRALHHMDLVRVLTRAHELLVSG